MAVHNREGRGRVVLLCEHASNYIPAHYKSLGLDANNLLRHIAWDPGAAETALKISRQLDAPLACATHSRLLLDLNRPLDAIDSIVACSEDTVIPGNAVLDLQELQQRHSLYAPYHREVESMVTALVQKQAPVAVIAIHSFTPSYHGVVRPWHIGVLSQHDRRLADALLAILREDASLCVGDNEPYAPHHGVYHSVEQHGEAHGLPCVMLEIRNDLIADTQGQDKWANQLCNAIDRALDALLEKENDAFHASLNTNNRHRNIS